MTRRLALIIAATLMLLLAAIASSRLGSRTVTGTVMDKRGNALPGAVVQMENTISLNVRSYITGTDGRFHFTGVSEDMDYTVRAHYANLWSDTKTISKFSSAAHMEVLLVIPTE